MQSADVRLTKEEVNIVLSALEMHADVHNAISGGLGHQAIAIMDKIIEAGRSAGWEEAEPKPPTVIATSTVRVVKNTSNGDFEEAPAPPLSPFDSD